MILWLKSVRTDCQAVDPLFRPVGSSYNQVMKSRIIAKEPGERRREAGEAAA